MQIGILGPLQVTDDAGRPVAVAGARLRRLLSRLALDAGRAVSTDELLDAVWPADPPHDVANALQSLVSRLRRALGDGAPIRQTPAGYRLDVPPAAVDAQQFTDLAAAGRRAELAGDHRGAVTALARALALWRGAPLSDGADAPYVAAPIARWDEVRVAARGDRAAAAIALGDAAGVIAELEELVAANPLREQLVGLLMTALAATGRAADALAAYQQLRERLADQLGTDPGRELQEQHLALLRGEAPDAPDRPAAAPARRSNLRAAVSSFIGRDAELARIGAMVGQGRLTTIVGPGGAGKTRLATEAASPLVARNRDGVWLVELAPVSDGDAIAQAVLGAFGLRDARILERRADLGPSTGSMSATDRVLDTLAESDALIVIDNCEHLIGAVAEFVELLLARCPEVRVLATSREPLGVPGEGLVAVPPLRLPPAGASPAQAAGYPAVQLLVARGQASRADFALTDATVGPVIDVVRRLDGLPLAIELAAARLRVLTVTEIAERLSDRFRLLAGGVRTSVARHRTLRGVVEWSWDLLTGAERLLAERLAIFPAGATAGSATRVCADGVLPEAEVPDLLLALVDKSLLQVVAAGGGATRYRMLETIREYGTERLDERGELAGARRRHAAYFAERAHALNPLLRGREQLDALAELTIERDNLLAAARYLGDSGAAAEVTTLVLDLSWYWNIIGGHSEMATWTRYALDVSRDLHPDDRVRLEAVSLLARIAGPAPQVEMPWEDLQASLSDVAARLAAIDGGDDPQTTMTRMYLTFFSQGPSGFAEMYAGGRGSADPWVRAVTSSMRVFLLENDGDIEQLRAEIEVALAGFEGIGDRWGMSQVLTARAGVRGMDGDVDGALADFRLALSYLDQLGATEDDMIVHLKMAGLRMRRGDFAEAHRHVEAVRNGRSGVPVPLERALLGEAALVGVLLAEGEVARAEGHAADLRRRLPDEAAANPYSGHLHAMIGTVCSLTAVACGDPVAARRDLDVAYPAAVSTTDRPLLASVAVAVAAYADALGRAGDGAEILGAAAALRGADDHGDVGIARVRERLVAGLGRAAFDERYAAGRSLDRDTAARRIDPELLEGSAAPESPGSTAPDMPGSTAPRRAGARPGAVDPR